MHKLRTGHLFAGVGGGILADLLLGHQPIFAVEIGDYPRKVLEQRQADGLLPFFPTFGDIKEFDGTPWRGSVDVLCGGFPCQDISAAGKGAGISGERSGLWKEYARLIGEMRPKFVFAENSPLLRTRGLGVVLEDLASLGYNARWGIIGARDVGAPHKRDRMWVLAYARRKGIHERRESAEAIKEWCRQRGIQSDGIQSLQKQEGQSVAYAMHQGLQGGEYAAKLNPQGRQESDGSAAECGSLWWREDPAERTVEPIVGRVVDGLPDSLDRAKRLKAIGNAQVPQCAAMAFSILSEGLI